MQNNNLMWKKRFAHARVLSWTGSTRFVQTLCSATATEAQELVARRRFDDSRVYLDSNLVLGDDTTHIKSCSLELVGLDLRLHGAVLSSSLTDRVSHVVVDSK